VAKKRRTNRQARHGKGIPLSVWLEAGGLALLGIALITALSLLSPNQGSLTGRWLQLLRRAFGWGTFVLPVLLGAGGLALFLTGFGRPCGFRAEWFLGAILLYVGGLGLAHYAMPDPARAAQEGQGGGHLGYFLARSLGEALGAAGAVLVLLTLAIGGLVALFDISPSAVVGALHRSVDTLLAWCRTHARRSEEEADPMRDESLPIRSARMPEPVRTPKTLPEGPQAPRGELLVPRIVGGATEWHLPVVSEILERGAEQELSQSEIRSKVHIIEETLNSFGVPAKVVEVNQGPSVTQFGLEPGFVERKESDGKIRRSKVKVNRISALADDLALALAASPIRIEAPVPGRSLVGIEVPNVSISMVSLYSVIESESFYKINSRLRFALGQDVAGQAVAADLAQMPHLLIAGATGSGKSVCINSIIACLLLHNTPEDLRMIMVDPKMVELTNYNGIPHLLVPVVVNVERVVVTLNWVTKEMERRYKLFSQAGARHIEAYNEINVASGEKKLPYIVVFIDELADLMMVAPDEVERSICRIAQLARATGIHLVIATQRPSVDVVTGLIKANFPSRISFAVTSQVDSRVIIDTAGAEKLLGRGDMLYMASDSSKLVRMQGCFVSDAELQRLVSFWRKFESSAPLPPGSSLVQQTLWEETKAKEPEITAQDGLLNEAIKIVRDEGRASISLLQRRLRVGYLRAARLIDAMEQMGVVGPDEGMGIGRRVLPEDSSEGARAASDLAVG